MAADAARKIDKKLNQKLEESAKEAMKKYVDGLVNKYVPQPVILVTKEYGGSFYTQNYAHVVNKNTRIYRTPTTSIKLPYGIKIEVSDEEYKEFIRYADTIDRIEDKRRTDREIWEARLRGIGTLKKLQELLPEAVEYVNWPRVVSVPAVDYSEIRNELRKIKE